MRESRHKIIFGVDPKGEELLRSNAHKVMGLFQEAVNREIVKNMGIPADLFKDQGNLVSYTAAAPTTEHIIEDMHKAIAEIERLPKIEPMPIVERSEALGRKRVQHKLPRSKKKRIRKKWRRNPKNWRYEWDEVGYRLPSIDGPWGLIKIPGRIILSPPLHDKYLELVESHSRPWPGRAVAGSDS